MKPLGCWFGRHSWAKQPTKDGEEFVYCTHCGKPYQDSNRSSGRPWPQGNDLYHPGP